MSPSKLDGTYEADASDEGVFSDVSTTLDFSPVPVRSMTTACRQTDINSNNMALPGLGGVPLPDTKHNSTTPLNGLPMPESTRQKVAQHYMTSTNDQFLQPMPAQPASPGSSSGSTAMNEPDVTSQEKRKKTRRKRGKKKNHARPAVNQDDSPEALANFLAPLEPELRRAILSENDEIMAETLDGDILGEPRQELKQLENIPRSRHYIDRTTGDYVISMSAPLPPSVATRQELSFSDEDAFSDEETAVPTETDGKSEEKQKKKRKKRSKKSKSKRTTVIADIAVTTNDLQDTPEFHIRAKSLPAIQRLSLDSNQASHNSSSSPFPSSSSPCVQLSPNMERILDASAKKNVEHAYKQLWRAGKNALTQHSPLCSLGDEDRVEEVSLPSINLSPDNHTGSTTDLVLQSNAFQTPIPVRTHSYSESALSPFGGVDDKWLTLSPETRTVARTPLTAGAVSSVAEFDRLTAWLRQKFLDGDEMDQERLMLGVRGLAWKEGYSPRKLVKGKVGGGDGGL